MASNMYPKTRTHKMYQRRLRRTVHEIPDGVVTEILIRLPVKSLVRFKSVSKAWCAIISDPLFIRWHLQHKRQQRQASFLITPHTVDEVIEGQIWPTTFSNKVPFYLWQEGQESACLLHSKDFSGEFSSVYTMSHCDGLVIMPTNSSVYVINPAMGDVLKLPDGQKDVAVYQTVGFGLDSRTNKYKVARSFYRSINHVKRTYDAGMEVFTICDDGFNSCWRSTVDNPPYPIQPQIPTYLQGSIYWLIWEGLLGRPPRGFLRFSLEDETFSFICQPPLLSDDNDVDLAVLGGDLCVIEILIEQMVIWMASSGDGREWVRLYNITSGPCVPLFRTVDARLLVRRAEKLFHHDEASQDMKEVISFDRLEFKNPRVSSVQFVKDIFFDVTPYTESLVPLTKAAGVGLIY